jgi:A/G-specific adenine glycosylase
LHKTAQYVAWELVFFPDNYNDLLKLKGVGEYTAAAIASFPNEVVPVVDVFRVLSRYFDVETDIALLLPKSLQHWLSN